MRSESKYSKINDQRSPQRQSPQRQSPQRQSPQRQSPQRQSPQRQSNCKSDEEINPQNGRCRKKCKSDQIRNPESGRCVKRSGAVGKRILQSRRSPQRQSPQRQSPQRQSPQRQSPQRQSPQRQSPQRQSPQRANLSPDSGGRDSECNDDEVFDIESGECINKTSVPGAAILANRKIDMSSLSPQMFESGIIIPRGSDVDATNYSVQYGTYMNEVMFKKAFAKYLGSRHKDACVWGGNTTRYTNPGMAIDTRKNMSEMLKDMRKNVRDFEVCKQENKRFVIFVITFISGTKKNPDGHANLGIYDTRRKTLERYEPHGSSTTAYPVSKVNKVFTKFVKEYLGRDVTYLQPLDFCPRLGHQSYETFQRTGAEGVTQKKSPNYMRSGDPAGFCIAWSMWYADLRLSNPDEPKTTLITKSIEVLKNKPQSMRRFIRNYSAIILRVVRKINVVYMNEDLDEEQMSAEIQRVVDEAVRKYS